MKEKKEELEIDTSFFKRMKQANINLENSLIETGSIEIDEKYGKGLVFVGILFLFVALFFILWLFEIII